MFKRQHAALPDIHHNFHGHSYCQVLRICVASKLAFILHGKQKHMEKTSPPEMAFINQSSPSTGFAIIIWNNPNQLEKAWHHQGTCYLSIFLGARFSHVTVGDYGGPRSTLATSQLFSPKNILKYRAKVTPIPTPQENLASTGRWRVPQRLQEKIEECTWLNFLGEAAVNFLWCSFKICCPLMIWITF